jgi:hypothetical protein
MPALYLPPQHPDPAHPFEGDRLERKALAGRLTKMIDRLPAGAVFALDAAWGDGKSWFGRNWHADLLSKDYKSAYVDTFAADYMEDPFFLLAGEISIALNQGKVSDLKKRGAEVAKALAPITTKVLLNAVGKLLGTNDITGKYAEAVSGAAEAAAETVENMITEKITDYEREKSSVTAFKKQLAILAEENFKKTAKPIIIFVDELDRCKPDFAVKTIERIKHFFEVKHVVFILLLNKGQIHESIRGVYGANIDAERYLGKFIQFSLTFPKRAIPDENPPYKDFARQKLHDYGFEGADDIDMQAAALATCAEAYSLTLRDIERCIILISLNPQSFQRYHPLLIAFGPAIKIGYPNAFDQITNPYNTENNEINSAVSRIFAGNEEFCMTLNKLHSMIITKSGADDEIRVTAQNNIGFRSRAPEKELLKFYEALSLKIE